MGIPFVRQNDPTRIAYKRGKLLIGEILVDHDAPWQSFRDFLQVGQLNRPLACNDQVGSGTRRAICPRVDKDIDALGKANDADK